MAQFDVFSNPRSSRRRAPFVVDVQTDLLELAMRLVVPLVHVGEFDKRMDRLNPVFEINGQYVVLTPTEMAGLPARELGQHVASLRVRRDDIVAALDLLLTGT